MFFRPSSLPLTAVALCFATTSLAQTFTNCNPLNTTNCLPDLALGTNATFNWTSSKASSSIWNQTAGTLNYVEDGAQFVINQKGDSPTIQSQFYIFGGRVETVMKTASGAGIISTVVLESDDLDEVDWEFIGSNTTHGETNYYSKGNQSAIFNSIYYPVSSPPQQDFHNYTTIWTKDSLQWWIDGQMVRELTPDAAYGGGDTYPQTPMTVRIGIWSGGDSSQPGTVAWAGGKTDYSQAPFIMTVKSIYVEDFSTGSQYTYGDETGSWDSIQIANGTSKIYQDLNKPTMSSRVANLSAGAKLGIAIGAISVVVIAIATFFICCIRMRRAGHRERLLADAAYEKDAADNMAMRDNLAREQAEWKRMNSSNVELLSSPRSPYASSPLSSPMGRPHVQGGYI